MELDWFLIIPLMLSIPIHELGHYIAYRYYGYKPTLRLTWWGAIFIGENVYKRIPLNQMKYIAIAGPLAGLIVTIWNPLALFIYLLSCMYDFFHLAVYIWLWAKGENLKGLTIAKLESRQKNQDMWKKK